MGLKFQVVAYGGFDRVRRGSIILRRSGGLSQFLVSVCGYIRICLAVYGSEIIGGLGVEEKSQKTKAVCVLGRTNYGGLRNVRPPIIDPIGKLTWFVHVKIFTFYIFKGLFTAQKSKYSRVFESWILDRDAIES